MNQAEIQEKIQEEAGRERVDRAFTALINQLPVRVITLTREFEGQVFQLVRSTFEPHMTAGIVDTQGRVHFVRLTKGDCYIEIVRDE